MRFPTPFSKPWQFALLFTCIATVLISSYSRSKEGDSSAHESHWTGELNVNFGVIPFNADVSSLSHVFTLRNNSKQALRIVEAAQDCTCMFVEVPNEWVEPGNLLRMKVAVKKPEKLVLDEVEGKASFLVKDNSSEVIKFTVETCWSKTLSLFPPKLRLYAPIANAATGHLMIRSVDNTEFNSSAAKFSLKDFDLKCTMDGTNQNGTALTLHFYPHGNPALVSGMVELKNEHGRFIRVPVEIEYFEKLRIRDPLVYLGSSQASQVIDLELPILSEDKIIIERVIVQDQNIQFTVLDDDPLNKRLKLRMISPNTLGIHRIPIVVQGQGSYASKATLIANVIAVQDSHP